APNPRRPLRPDDAQLPYRVARHPRPFSARFGVYWYRHWLAKLHADWPFDILHCHGIDPPGYLAAILQSRLRVPVVITSHGGDVYEGASRLSKAAARRRAVQALAAADALVAISRFTEEGFRRLCPDVRRIEQIPNGVDPQPFATAADCPPELQAAGLSSKQYLLFLGRIHERKGVDLLIEAFRHLKGHNSLRLVLAGDGPQRAECERTVAETGLTSRVWFAGTVRGNAKTWLLQNALVAIMPTRTWEAFPLVVLESYAAGTPIVASRTPGLADLVQPDQTGMLFEPGASADLCRALQQALQEPAKLATWGENARRMAKEYAWPKIAGQHLALYQQLLAERKQHAAA
ncbi:MAG: glycosyltransferase family 4 protein, partial [Pirellulales bacterium]